MKDLKTNHPVVTAGVDQMRDLLVQHFPPYYLEIVKPNPRGARYQLLHKGKIAVHTATYGAEIRVGTSESFDFYAIMMPLRGSGGVMLNGRDVTAPISLIGPKQKIDMRWSLDHEVLLMQVPLAAMEEALEAYLGDPPKERLRFEPGVDATSALGHALAVLASAGTGGTLPFAASKLAEHHFEQFLLHTLLASQPHNYSDELRESAPWTPAVVRRASRYCEDHAGEPISLADIAAAARVSVRTLQLGFREHLQTTPMAYLRSVRLAHAHADLLRIADTGCQTTVTEVALRWGFPHLGRFAALYRQTYGRLPSSTRQGRR
ncbi:AraC family transcriptional regulator [Nonomuraea angiospora]|uniref:AraC family transcriptional regulator n=1 Tax=Nonomuraea angiospora TaxID=46172 RepID=UPI003448EF21